MDTNRADMNAVRRLRILLINDAWDPGGGAEANLRLLVDGLRRRGHAVEVMAFGSSRSPVDPSVHLVPHPSATWRRLLARALWEPGLYGRVRDVVRRARPDVIHVLNIHAYPAVVLSALSRPTVWHLLDHLLVCPTNWLVTRDTGRPCPGGPGLKCLRHCLSLPQWLGRMLRHASLRSLLRRVRVISMAPTWPKLRRSLRRRVVPLPKLCPTGQFWSDGVPEARRDDILFVGRLSSEKGLDVLMDAMDRLALRRPDAGLVLVGDGPMRPPLEARVSSSRWAGRVTGWLTPAELSAHYRGAAVLAMPVLWFDLGPGVIIEALAHGLPVVCSDRCGYGDLVRDSGSGAVVPAGDAAALAEALCALLDDPDRRRRMGEAGRRDAAAYVKADGYVEAAEAHYRAALGEAG